MVELGVVHIRRVAKYRVAAEEQTLLRCNRQPSDTWANFGGVGALRTTLFEVQQVDKTPKTEVMGYEGRV